MAWRIAREHDWATLRDAESMAICRVQADVLISVDPPMALVCNGFAPPGSLAALLAID